MVQGTQKQGDIKIESEDNKKTTLVISQDFPKKHADQGAAHNIEMIQNKVQDPSASPFEGDDKSKTTLVIGQDFVQ